MSIPAANHDLLRVQEEIDEVGRRAYARQVEHISRQLPKWRLQDADDPRVALAHVHSCLDLILDNARRQAAALPSVQWLEMLRVVPQGRLSTDGQRLQIVRASAECLASSFGRTGGAVSTSLHWAERDLTRLMRLIASVNVLEYYRNLYRLVSHGARLKATGGVDAPDIDVPPDVQAAESLFHARQVDEEQASSAAIIGTPLISLSDISQAIDDDGFIALGRLKAPEMRPDWARLLAGQPVAYRLLAQYEPVAATPEPLLLAGAELLAKSTPLARQRLVCLLMACRGFTAMLTQRPGEWMNRVFQLGVLYISDYSFEAFWRKAWAVSADYLDEMCPGTVQPSQEEFRDVLRCISTLGNDPYYGTPLLKADEGYLLDMESAYYKLMYAAAEAISNSGKDAKGPHFNQAVQESIDAGSWAPGQNARRLIGHHKLNNGRQIDVDAVGENDGRLLLVEAKSYPRTGLHQAGDFNTVYNRVGDLEAALSTQEKRRSGLLTTGSRVVDINQWREIVIAVCIPGALWLPTGDLTAGTSSGLRAVCTLHELQTVLAY